MEQPSRSARQPRSHREGLHLPAAAGPGAVIGHDGTPGYACDKHCPIHGLEVLKRALAAGQARIMRQDQENDEPTRHWGPTADDLRAKVFRDREHTGDWRVEKMDDDSGIEVALFSGGDARQRAISYADRMYGEFDEIELAPYHRAPPLGQVLDDLSRSGIAVSIEAMPCNAGYTFWLGDSGNIEGFGESIFDLVMRLCASRLSISPTANSG